MDGSQNRMPCQSRNRDWRLSLAAALWAGLILLVVVISARKRAGAFESPESSLSTFLVAGLALGPSLFAFALCRAAKRHIWTTTARVILSAMTVVPPLALGTVLLPADSSMGIWFATSMLGVSALALLVVGAERAGQSRAGIDQASLASVQTTARRIFSAYAPAAASRETLFPAVSSNESHATATSEGRTERRLHLLPRVNDDRHEASIAQVQLAAREPSIGFANIETENRSQQLVRSHSPSRGDVLEGSIRVTFTIGQRQANVHIPFVPPFAAVPEVECEMLEGCEVRLNVGTVQTFGTRIEIKRLESIDVEAAVEIGFAAIAAGPQAHAA